MPKAKKKNVKKENDATYLKERREQARAEARGDAEDQASHEARHSVSYVGPRSGAEEAEEEFTERLEAAVTPAEPVASETPRRSRARTSS